MLKILFFLIIVINVLYKIEIDEVTPIIFNSEKINLYESEKVFIQNSNDWYLTIPKINLNKIPIKDGISDEILENYIGHFPISPFLQGNVCLAAHNNGYINNYFSNIDKLEIGDEIYYHYFNIEKVYKVKNKKLIDEKELLYIDTDDEEKITLITCVENSPHKRLCIQAISKE